MLGHVASWGDRDPHIGKVGQETQSVNIGYRTCLGSLVIVCLKVAGLRKL